MEDVKVYDRTQDAVICYRAERAGLIAALSAFSFAKAEDMELVPEHTARALNREFEDKLVWKTALHYACKLFLPDLLRRMAPSWCALVVAALLRKSIVACSRSCCCQGTMLSCKKLWTFKNTSKTNSENGSYTLYKLKGVFLNGVL